MQGPSSFSERFEEKIERYIADHVEPAENIRGLVLRLTARIPDLGMSAVLNEAMNSAIDDIIQHRSLPGGNPNDAEMHALILLVRIVAAGKH